MHLVTSQVRDPHGPFETGSNRARRIAADHTTTDDQGREANSPRARVVLEAPGSHVGVMVARALRNESNVPARDQFADIAMQ